jgi:hypothetical protein
MVTGNLIIIFTVNWSGNTHPAVPWFYSYRVVIFLHEHAMIIHPSQCLFFNLLVSSVIRLQYLFAFLSFTLEGPPWSYTYWNIWMWHISETSRGFDSAREAISAIGIRILIVTLSGFGCSLTSGMPLRSKWSIVTRFPSSGLTGIYTVLSSIMRAVSIESVRDGLKDHLSRCIALIISTVSLSLFPHQHFCLI